MRSGLLSDPLCAPLNGQGPSLSTKACPNSCEWPSAIVETLTFSPLIECCACFITRAIFQELEEGAEKLTIQTKEWKEAIKHRESAKADFEEVHSAVLSS